jgi:hypothetical protein
MAPYRRRLAEDLLVRWFRAQVEPFPWRIGWFVAEKITFLVCWVMLSAKDWAYYDWLCQDLADQMSRVFSKGQLVDDSSAESRPNQQT